MTPEPSILSIESLSFRFPGQAKSIVADLNLAVRRGEIISILGASGCGKTTVLNLIAGLLKPEYGKIAVSSRASASEKSQNIGYIFQKDALMPWSKVEGNLMLACKMGKGFEKNSVGAIIRQYLSVFHLDESILNKYPDQLSGGMRQRVSIIQALMFDPELLLLDEPFSALDYYTKLSLEEEFCSLVRQKNKSAIMVTHDIEEAVAMSDRAFIMDAGRLSREFKISDTSDKENRRGSERFAQKYSEIWSQLQAIVGNSGAA